MYIYKKLRTAWLNVGNFSMATFALLLMVSCANIYDKQANIYDDYRAKLDTATSCNSLKGVNDALEQEMVFLLRRNSQEVVAAAKAAKIHNYIMKLPDEYNTILSDDSVNISKGQKQLITIARAMLADAPMLILDEATSNVDSRTERRIQDAMYKLMEGRTCFVIAHRLSTIQNADLILVLKDGEVIEQGNHEELMAKNGFYAELYGAQFKHVGA